MGPAGLLLLRRPERWISPLSKACGFPFKTVFAGSKPPCGLPLLQRVRKSGGQSFGLTVYLLPHYNSHPAPWAQQAFTCCADLNGGSAFFRRHVAFPSRQFLQAPNSLVVCPCRNVLGGLRSILSDRPHTCFHITSAMHPHGPNRPLPAAQIRMTDQPSFEGMWLSLQDCFCRFQAALWFAPVAMC
jgi:hypothetical protein